jgi:hypothetical protein
MGRLCRSEGTERPLIDEAQKLVTMIASRSTVRAARPRDATRGGMGRLFAQRGRNVSLIDEAEARQMIARDPRCELKAARRDARW